MVKIFINNVPITISLIAIEFLLFIYGEHEDSWRYLISFKEYYIYLYIFFSLLPIWGAIHGGFSWNNYLIGIKNMVVPIFFFFWGIIYKKYSLEKRKEISAKWCEGLFYCVLIGVIFHILNPRFYHDYVRASYLLSYATDIDIYFGGRLPRLRGIFLSSQMAGIVGVVGACLSIDNNLLKKGKKYLYLMVFGINSLLSYQRAAWVLFVCVLLYYMWARKRKIFWLITISFVPIVIPIVYLFREKIYTGLSIQPHGKYESSPLEILRSIPYVVTERFSMKGPRQAIIDFLEFPVLGKGLAHLGGSLDANYHRVIGDLGIIGFGLLILIIVNIARLTYRSSDFGMGLSVLCVAVNALGEPMFDNIVTGGLFFWLMVGCMWKTEEEVDGTSKDKCHSPYIQY